MVRIDGGADSVSGWDGLERVGMSSVRVCKLHPMRVHYRSVGVSPDHPLAAGSRQRLHGRKMRVSYPRFVLWEKLEGESSVCHWCGRHLVWANKRGGADTLCVDHLDGDRRNDSSENLVPSCRGCNGNRGRRIYERETCAHGHLWSENLYITPSGWKGCRTCSRERMRAFAERSRTCRG